MSVDMYLSNAKEQASSVRSMTRKQAQGYEQLQKAITDFIIASPFLTGKAYESAKTYFAQVLYPLAQGGILLSEAVERVVNKFPEEYIAKVDSGSLKQSDLEEQIRQASHLIQQAEEIRKQIQASVTPAEIKPFQLTANSMVLGVYQQVKKELEEKLKKLLTFNASSPTIFAEISSLQQAVDIGLSQTKTSWNRETGTFIIPKDLSWQKVVSDSWKHREEEQNKKTTYTVKEIKTQYGTFYQVIQNGVYVDEEATKAYNELKMEEDWETIKNNLSTAADAIDKLSFLIGNTLKVVGGGATTIVGVVGITGSYAVVELASGGTATVFLPGVAAAEAAVATAGTAVAIDGWNNLSEGYQGHVMYSNNGKITSKSFGKPIEGRVGTKKSKIRVDAEPDSNKIQIQTGGGKTSPLDERVPIEKITDKNSIYKLISKNVKKGLSKGKTDELVNNIWKAYIWLKTK